MYFIHGVGRNSFCITESCVIDFNLAVSNKQKFFLNTVESNEFSLQRAFSRSNQEFLVFSQIPVV